METKTQKRALAFVESLSASEWCCSLRKLLALARGKGLVMDDVLKAIAELREERTAAAALEERTERLNGR